MNTDILSKEQIEALKTLHKVWGKQKIVIIGATALGFFIDMRWRKTHDLDLSISVSLNKYQSDLAQIPGWSQDPKQEQQWSAPGGVRIDIIPATSILLKQGEFVWPKSGFRISLLGMRLAFEYGVPVKLAENVEIFVAPVPVIVVLKMIAFQEKRLERIRDLVDIVHSMEEFLPADDPRRYSDEIFDLKLSYEETSAFCLGKEIGSIVNEREQKEVLSFIAMARDDNDPIATKTRMLQESAAWRQNPQLFTKCTDAFNTGVHLGISRSQ
jgi:predicted nucleotidyltransferase